MSENDNEQQPAQRPIGTRAVQRAREAEDARRAEQAEVAARMERRLPPLGDRLKISKAAERQVAEARQAEHDAEQERVASVLEERRQQAQGDSPLPYAAQLTVFTLPPNNPSTKDLRTPTERRRDAAERWASSTNDDMFYE